MQSAFRLLFVVCSLFVFANAKFVKLTDDNIEDQLASGEWLVLFNDASEHAAEESLWKEVGKYAKDSKSSYKVGRVDCDKYPDALYDRNLKLKDLPKAFFLSAGDWQTLAIDKKSPEQILGGVSQLVHGNVTVLTSDNFESNLASGKPYLVEFYAPWCGHCKQLAPVWKDLANQAKKDDNFVVGKVDATVHPELGTKYGVTGYPTIKLFQNGEVIDYSGDRTIKSFKDFVANPKKPEPEKEEEDDDVPDSDKKKDEL